VSGGKAHTDSHALPGLTRLLEELPPEHRSFLVRSDRGFGNDSILREMETHQQPYLFKLKQSKNVLRLLVRQFQREDWVDAGQGWKAVDTAAIAQSYRDRADAENGFDELKNQWGWGGYTTRDIARCCWRRSVGRFGMAVRASCT